MTLKIGYISGPFVGNATKANLKEAIEKNIETAKKYAEVLANNKIGFFVPHINSVELNGKDLNEKQRFYYEQDTEFLIRAADFLVAIPGWETSFGARHEIKIAEELKLPVFYPQSPDDISEILEWHKTVKENNDKLESTLKGNVNWGNVISIREKLAKWKFA